MIESKSLMNTLQTILNNIPEGTKKVTYLGATYNLTKDIFNNGKSIKIFAEELGGTNFISGNFYETSSNFFIKPCEMPEEKVVSFLTQMKLKS